MSNQNSTFNKQLNARLDKSFLSNVFTKVEKELNPSTFAVGAAVKCFVFSFLLLSVCFRPFLFVKQMCVSLVGSM